MSILSSINRIAADFVEARSRYLTDRAIRSLPPELRKDIGWPEAYDQPSDPRANGGRAQ